MIQTNLLEIKYKKIQYWHIEETSNIIFSTKYCVVKDYIYFSRWERNGRRRQIISQWMFVCLFCWINVTNASHTDIIIHEHIFIWCRHNLFDHNRSSARDWARITRIQGPCFSSNRFPECVRALTEIGLRDVTPLTVPRLGPGYSYCEASALLLRYTNDFAMAVYYYVTYVLNYTSSEFEKWVGPQARRRTSYP